MSDRDLTVRITAVDQASPKFAAVAQASDRMGAAVQKAGQTGARGLDQLQREGQETTVALDRVAQSAARTDQAIQRGQRSYVAYGAAITTVLGTLSSFSQAAAEEEAIFARLEQSVENTGVAFDDYAQRIDGAIDAGERLAFADDQTAEALSRLTTVTGDAGEALNLMGLAMDLARERGISLSSAADIVGKVHAGNIGILARYGIAVTEGATAQEALAELQQRTAGQAEAYGKTTQANVDRIRNSLDNLQETIGAHAGGLQTALVLLPGLSAGYTLAGGAIGAMTTAARTATIANAGLLATMGPIGLVAAAVAAGAGIYYLTQRHEGEAEAVQVVNEEVKSLILTYGQLTETTMSQVALSGAREIALSWDAIAASIEAANRQAASANVYLPSVTGAGTMQTSAIVADIVELTGVQEDLNAVIANTGPGASAAREVVAEMIQDFLAGDLTARQFATGIDIIANSLGAYDEEAIKASASTTILTDDLEHQTAVLSTLNTSYLTGAGVGLPMMTGQQAMLADQTRQTTEVTVAYVDSLMLEATATQSTISWNRQRIGTLADLRAEQTASGAAAREAVDAINAERDAIVGLVTDLGQMPTLVDVAGSATSDFVSGMTADMERLGTAVSVIIDGTEALGSSSAQLDKWATDLIGPVDTLAEIDELLKRGAISQEEYNAAQQAQIEIARNNAAIQDDLLAIQVQQAPYLAEQQEAQVRQIDDLRHLGAEQQRVALGWMDVAEAQKAQDAVALIATAHTEEARQVVSATVEELVKANPILGEMLESIGAITVDRQGNITVNFDNAADLQSTITDLTEVLADLNDTLRGLPPGTTIRLHVEGAQEIWDAKQALTELYALSNQRIPDADFSRFATPDSLGLPSPPAPTHGSSAGMPAALQLPERIAAPPAPTGLPWAIGRRTFDLDTSGALASLGEMEARLASIEVPVIVVDADTAPAVLSVTEAVAITDASTGTVQIDGDNARALGAVDDAVATANAAAGTVSIGGDPSSLNNTIGRYDGRIVGTAYVNLVATGGTGFGLGLQMQHGGIIPHAANGMVVGMAEAGAERVDFPGGGGFMAMTPGLYGAPSGSYVHTAPATRAMGGGGISVSLTIAGNVYGIDDLMGQVTDRLVPIIQQAASSYYGSQGWHG